MTEKECWTECYIPKEMYADVLKMKQTKEVFEILERDTKEFIHECLLEMKSNHLPLRFDAESKEIAELAAEHFQLAGYHTTVENDKEDEEDEEDDQWFLMIEFRPTSQ